MIKLKLFSAAVGILILLGQCPKAADFENRTFVGGQTKIRNMDVFFHSANFFKNGSDYFLNHTQLTLGFPSEKNINFGMGYKQEYVKFPARWRTEYRLMLHMYYNKKLGNFNFRDRNRWEFRMIDGELINRYRNQLQLSYKKFRTFTPYLSTEFSFYLSEPGYSRQRTTLGTQIPVKRINFNLFFGHEVNEDFPDVWTHKLMTGISVIYRLNKRYPGIRY